MRLVTIELVSDQDVTTPDGVTTRLRELRLVVDEVTDAEVSALTALWGEKVAIVARKELA